MKGKKDSKKIDIEENSAYKGSNGEEIVFEEDATPTELIKKLRDKLRACEKERQEFLDGWQRARADYQNQRRLGIEQREAEIARLQNALFEKLIPIADSFDMAFMDTARWEAIDPVWRRGMENIHAQLLTLFDEFGIHQIAPRGVSFDPAEHDSVALVPTVEKEKDNVVADVLQKGYKRGERVIRPARVKVFQYTPEQG